MGASSNLFLVLILSAVLVTSIISFQPFAFADDEEENDDEPKTLVSECAEELDDDDFDLEGLFCIAIFALQDAIDDLLNLIFGLQAQVDDLEERVAALENPPPPPPPPQPQLFAFVNGQAVNSFGGSQVVEVVIEDPGIDDTDESKGEPDVTVNENSIRIVQGVDGKWYAFFAHRANALIADSGVVNPGTGLDFGIFCSKDSGFVLGPTIDVTETEGFAIQDPDLVTNEVNGNPAGSPLTNVCTDPNPTATPNDFMAVLNGVIEIPPIPSVDSAGQIGIRQGFWPFIQLFSFNVDDEVKIIYFRGGQEITVSLTFTGP